MLNFFSRDNPKYPKLLKQISDAPKQLYYKGNWNEQIFENCLAVVGSRRMTSYGRQAVERLIGEIASSGITIVSGFMYGVDATSHKTTVRVGGRTIAVMPCGIERIHPEYQEDLYSEILENNGLVISEFDKDQMPALWTYPKRNRIVAGLSKAVLVVEAGPKSGSLITANLAKKFERKLFVVPGPITSEVSKGALQLIKDGAEMVTSAKDVLRYFSLRKQNFANRFPLAAPYPSASSGGTPRFENPVSSAKSHNSKTSFSSPNSFQKKILNELETEPMEIDFLSHKTGIPVAKLGTILSLMQLRGIISKKENKYYAD
jgi:DNA processing protein